MHRVQQRRRYIVLVSALSMSFVATELQPFILRAQDRPAQMPLIVLDLSRDDGMKPNEPYRVGQPVRVKLIAKNEYAEEITVPVTNVYSQNRLELFRNGKLVAYRPEIARAVREGKAGEDMISVGRRDFIRLPPYTSATLRIINLSDWYPSLDPGSYQLTTRFRPQLGAPWSEDSKPVVFEVATQK